MWSLGQNLLTLMKAHPENDLSWEAMAARRLQYHAWMPSLESNILQVRFLQTEVALTATVIHFFISVSIFLLI